MRTPADVLADLLRSDPARPRVTSYDDTPGPAAGERIELSARVLGNWVSKVGNLLQDEADVEPGAVVRLDLPPHWRAVAWALGVWSVGGCVALGDGPEAAVTVSDDPDRAARAAAGRGLGVLVTLPALARSAPDPVAPGVVDEARELATYPDHLEAMSPPAPGDPALHGAGPGRTYADVVPDRGWPQGARVHTAAPSLGEVLDVALAAFAVDGSLVVSRGPVGPAALAARLDAEGVTLRR